MNNLKEMHKASIVNGKLVWGDDVFSLKDTSPTMDNLDKRNGIVTRTPELKRAIDIVRTELNRRNEQRRGSK